MPIFTKSHPHRLSLGLIGGMSRVMAAPKTTEVYPDQQGQKRWHVVENGRIISASTEGYHNDVDVLRSIDLTISRLTELRKSLK